MKPELDDLLKACPDVVRAVVEAHRTRLDEAYFEAFPPDRVAEHIRAVARLSSERPVELLVRALPVQDADGQEVECTIVSFDYAGVFSLITGLLAAAGMAIESGDVFTYARAATHRPHRTRRRSLRRSMTSPSGRRCIIDAFRGRLSGGMDLNAWAEGVEETLAGVVRLLEQGGDDRVSEARHRVNERVAEQLSRLQPSPDKALYPVAIDVLRSEDNELTLRVVSQDTPGFLYAMSNALALQGISIERVRINTVGGQAEDELDIVDRRGERIADAQRLDTIRLLVLLTKQFTYFLGQAPNPYAALSRFEKLAGEVIRRPERGQWLELFSDPDALQDLARILGASDFIWEDFVRLQYEALLPMLGPDSARHRASFDKPALRRRLNEALAGAGSAREREEALNAWKDREIFLIDLDHILNAGVDVQRLAEPLTRVAELVVEEALRIAAAPLLAQHGTPRTVGGLEARWAVFGLGKLGGVALGYASDIELLLVYSDTGRTDGPEAVPNAQFFDELAGALALAIRAKREGIFHVDLRLRPHGASGPRASSLESFCRYYGQGGSAHSYERLALTRLRFIAGAEAFGAQVERLRNAFVYEGGLINLDELQALRERQLADKASGQRYNAKFSPGALVDVEYFVQILQTMHGGRLAELRTPRIHEALAAMAQAGIMAADEVASLTEAYYFLRRLINGLRMLRGSARDLFLPERGEHERAHLARRMGYRRGQALAPEEQLHVDFETHTAVVRAFIERHFGLGGRRAYARGNIVDVILSEAPSPELTADVFNRAGFDNHERARVNLRYLAGSGAQRAAFLRLAVLAIDHLRRSPDADMALNNWERFVRVLPDATAHYDHLLAQPRRLELLIGVLGGSQFLADTLVRDPGFLEWVTDPDVLQGARPSSLLAQDLAAFMDGAANDAAARDVLRRFRRREILRIGIRDLCLQAPLAEITGDLAAVADTLVQESVRREWARLAEADAAGPLRDACTGFCVLGFGKLGGRELNYSSDIDLVAVWEDSAAAATGLKQSEVQRLMERVRDGLSRHTGEGYVYRVDLRLRPHGRAGTLVPEADALCRYYETKARPWEIQALLKARVIAGDTEFGGRLLDRLHGILRCPHAPEVVRASIRKLRHAAVQSTTRDSARDVKSGLGGIRDIEFLAQARQLIHVGSHPELLVGNTLEALRRLAAAGLLESALAEQLAADYVFLRRVEHCLQILEDRQIHAVPVDDEKLGALARRLDGPSATGAALMQKLRETRSRTYATYREEVEGST